MIIQNVILLMVLFLGLMVCGVPIAFSLSISALVTAMATGQFSATAIVHRMIGNSSSYTLLAIPFFILAAKLMNTGGITSRIFRAASAWVGSIPGGLGHANIVASVIFSGMSGSAVADAGGLGQIEVDAMKEQGFDAEFSAAVTCASATIGPIIPPSVPMVVYGMMTGVSVGSLFIGGVIPGLLLAVACSVLVYIMAKKRNYPVQPFSWKEVGESTKEALLSLLTPVIIIGGIWTGIFSPTEAACVASVYAFILSVLVYKGMTKAEVIEAIKQTVSESAAILLIICGAAAKNITDAGREEMRRIIDLFRENADANIDTADIDKEFHLCVARASANYMYLQMMEVVFKAMDTEMWTLICSRTVGTKYFRQNYEEHRVIGDMIMSGNAEGAYICMKEHMENLVERYWE